MTVDPRLATYARDHWSSLVGYAAPLGDDPELAEQTVVRALARLADSAQLPAVTTDDELEQAVRRAIVRSGVGADGRWWASRAGRVRSDGPRDDIQVMEVVSEAAPVEVTSEERVRRAVAGLPGRQRAAVVLRCRDQLEDAAIGELMDCSPESASQAVAAGLGQLADALGLDAVGSRVAAVGGAIGEGSPRTTGLVAAALAEAPAPSLTEADPLAAIGRRATWVRRSRVGGVAAAAIVVLAGFGAAFTVSSHPGHRFAAGRSLSAKAAARASARAFGIGALSHLPHPFDEGAPAVPVLEPRLLSRSPSAFATAVTAGGGYLWTIEVVPTARGSRSVVVQRDPTTNLVVRSIRVPSADNEVGYGDKTVWTWSSNNASRRTVIGTLNGLDSGTLTFSPSVAIQSAAFTASGRTWFAVPSQDAVKTYDHGFAIHHSLPVPGARFPVAVSRSEIVVASGNTIRELPGGQTVDATQGDQNGPATRLTLLESAPSYALWIAHGRELVYQARVNGPIGQELLLPHRVFAVVGDPKHGVFVATHSENPLNHDPYLVYYSPQSLASARPSATFRLDGSVQAESMVADPAGGIVYTTNMGAVVRWDPAG